ncbi:MAG: DUF4142 domain-containing protein [Alphaproteobacteria bacterium]|nr:DUF4142 domain-containing protein [Alphaproteobacteria bacterium]
MAPSPAKFVEEALAISTQIIKVSELALAHPISADTRLVASNLVSSQNQLTTSLGQVVANTDANLATAIAPENEHMAAIKTLQDTAPDLFEARYIDTIRESLENLQVLYADYAKDGGSEPLRNFASSSQPDIEAAKNAADSLNLSN